MPTSAVFPPVQDIFPELEPTEQCLRSLVVQLSRTDTLLWCARSNLVCSNPANTELEQEQFFLDTFFPDDKDRQRLTTWILGHGGPGACAVFFRAQLLELARWVAIFGQDAPGDGETFQDPVTRRRFGQAAMVAASLWGQRMYDAANAFATLDVSEARTRAMPILRASYIENARGAVPLVALGRGYLVWSRYFPLEWPQLDEAFKQATGIALHQYYLAMAAIFVEHIDVRASLDRPTANPSGLFKPTHWDGSLTLKEPFRRFVALNGISIEELAQRVRHEGDGHIAVFRDHPIIRTRDDRVIVIDPVFLTDKALVGPLFALLPGTSEGGAHKMFGFFGRTCERYVVELLRQRYCADNRTPTMFPSVELYRGKDRVAEIDAVVATGPNEIVIIEIKAVFIRDEYLSSVDRYLDALRAKYAARNEAGPGSGSTQLANVACKLAEGSITRVPEAVTHAKQILPVLIVFDHHLDAPGHSRFLRAEFVNRLGVDPQLTLNFGILGNFGRRCGFGVHEQISACSRPAQFASGNPAGCLGFG